MTTCPKCGSAVPGGALECPSCGVVIGRYRKDYLAPSASTAAEDAGVRPPRGASPPPAQPAARPTPRISTATLEALDRARPWISFLAVYGIIVAVLLLLGGSIIVLSGFTSPRTLPLGIAYVISGFSGLAILPPLHRSATALKNLTPGVATSSLETFITEQLSFYRRVGVLSKIHLWVSLIVIALAVIFGALMATTR